MIGSPAMVTWIPYSFSITRSTTSLNFFGHSSPHGESSILLQSVLFLLYPRDDPLFLVTCNGFAGVYNTPHPLYGAATVIVKKEQ